MGADSVLAVYRLQMGGEMTPQGVRLSRPVRPHSCHGELGSKREGSKLDLPGVLADLMQPQSALQARGRGKGCVGRPVIIILHFRGGCGGHLTRGHGLAKRQG